MARQSRAKSKSGIYHIMLRGVNRQTIFEEEEDKERFLETIGKYKSNYHLYAYCLMDNHVHLLIKEYDDPISLLIKRICSSYVHWYNKKYFRCGHLFQERFKSENVENTSYFLIVLRYIHQNPLKAGLATDVFASHWTSIHEYLKKSNIVNTEFSLQIFSDERDKAVQMFTEYMKQDNDDKCLDDPQFVRISDNDVRNLMKKCGILHASHLQYLNRESRDAILVYLKSIEGVSIIQLARITGISKSVIQRAGK